MASKPAASTAVAVKGDPQLPAYLQGKEKTRGLQSMTGDDLVIPRIKLLQDAKREPTTFDSAKLGEFWLNVLDRPLGPKLKFIVCSDKKRVLLMRPMDDKSGSAVLARADDGKTWNTLGEWDVKIRNVKQPVKWKIDNLNVRASGLLEFGTSLPDDPDSNPAATLFYEYLVFLPDHPEVSPCVLSLARTAAKKARDLNGKIEFRNQDVQALMFEANVEKTGDGDMAYFNYVFQSSGFATEEQYKKCVDIADAFKNYRGADEEGAAAEADTKSGPTERGEV